MTNIEIIKTLFPNVGTNFSNVLDLNLWWNAQYNPKEEKSPHMEYYENMIILYECNPELNNECKKSACQQECESTSQKEYAKLDDFGNPIVNSITIYTIATYKLNEEE